MNARYLVGLMLTALVYGCAPGVDVAPMLADFDTYAKDLRAVATDPQAIATLETGQRKRAQAAALVEKGKAKDAAMLLEQAMADASLALEMDRMNVSTQRAETCRLEVEQARTKWREAVRVLEETEQSVGTKAPIETNEPVIGVERPALPATTLDPDSFPAPLRVVGTQWDAWWRALLALKVPAADLRTTYWHCYDRTGADRKDEATADHYRYLAARAVQSLECRVRSETNERVCVDATLQMAAFGDARAGALRATLDLERSHKDALRAP